MSENSDSPPPDPRPGAESTHNPSIAVPRRRRRHWFAWLALLLVVGVAGAHYWRTASERRATAPRTPPAVPVMVSQAEKGDIGVYVTGLGTVTPLNTITVTTRVDGQLMAVRYKEGDTVKKGAPLVEIDPRPFQVQLEQAEGQLAKDLAALQNARIDLNRYEDLITKHAVSQQILQTQRATVAQGEATVRTDQADIDSAKLNLLYCHITAPISGRIGLRLVDPGNFVSVGTSTPLLVITQTQPISVIFTIPEQQVPAVRAALRAGKSLPVDAMDRNGKKVIGGGTLTTLDNQIDQTTGTLRLRATMPNKDDALFPNQFVNARMLLERKKGVTLIPNAAVQRNGQTTFVYLVNNDRSVELRNVALGTVDDQRSEVTSGIKPHEVVVTRGVDRLQAGSTVVPISPEEEDTRRREQGDQAPVATSGRKGASAGAKP
ncbi:MAG TPA: MdtA/MuxA family multidrug efflux RND transporter periplasmic adaptor subunit [Vicinamibacterales bacterium]|nr:MdtA/MuxA family multidrug efflux RND transporter periplasmic adaptor subunit [Vicinamibacterales bacterium]